jgi:hypothetical protein
MTTRSKVRFALLIAATLVLGCSTRKAPEHREYSLGANGILAVAYDSEHRVRELRQLGPDGSPKLRVVLVYGNRDLQRFSVYDPKHQKVWESVFGAEGDGSSGRDSEVASPGWEIHYETAWSGVRGDIHDTRSWFCGEQLLYRIRRTWPDDRSRVYYEISGPTGLLLFTNTYVER